MNRLVFQPSTKVEAILSSLGLAHFAIVDPHEVFSDESERWKMHKNAITEWVEANNHGSMDYLKKNLEISKNPNLLLPSLKSAMVFLIPYGTGKRVRKVSKRQHEAGRQVSSLSESPVVNPVVKSIARYARFKDYHKVIKKRVSEALSELSKELGFQFEHKIAVDSVPFLDRAHAEMAGLGFIGKNTMLIRPGMGSYFFIASVLLDLDLSHLVTTECSPQKTSISAISCNDCTKCVDACPTSALDGFYKIDATKCFSYWSIESRTISPAFVKPAYKDLFFGCDISQQVCPYNEVTLDERRFPEFFKEAESIQSLSLLEIATMSKQNYEAWFGGLPLTRAKYSGLVRNALYSLAAQNETASLQKARAHWVSQKSELLNDKSFTLIFKTLEDIL